MLTLCLVSVGAYIYMAFMEGLEQALLCPTEGGRVMGVDEKGGGSADIPTSLHPPILPLLSFPLKPCFSVSLRSNP